MLFPIDPGVLRAVDVAVRHARTYQRELRGAQEMAAKLLTPTVLGDLAAELRRRRQERFLYELDHPDTEGDIHDR